MLKRRWKDSARERLMKEGAAINWSLCVRVVGKRDEARGGGTNANRAVLAIHASSRRHPQRRGRENALISVPPLLPSVPSPGCLSGCLASRLSVVLRPCFVFCYSKAVAAVWAVLLMMCIYLCDVCALHRREKTARSRA